MITIDTQNRPTELPLTLNGKEYTSVEEIKGQIKELEALGEQRGTAEDKLLDDLRGLDLAALEEFESKNRQTKDSTTTTETIGEEPKASKPKSSRKK